MGKSSKVQSTSISVPDAALFSAFVFTADLPRYLEFHAPCALQRMDSLLFHLFSWFFFFVFSLFSSLKRIGVYEYDVYCVASFQGEVTDGVKPSNTSH